MVSQSEWIGGARLNSDVIGPNRVLRFWAFGTRVFGQCLASAALSPKGKDLRPASLFETKSLAPPVADRVFHFL